MRLIETETLELHEFFDNDIPSYAILSHRWEQDEVSYQDMLEGKKKNGAGYAKILKCCALALREGYEWVWIDTCCIDKKSSTEISEAINSMFRWYCESGNCYAYLSDVTNFRDVADNIYCPDFKRSKWFTRGWTLQELLAPFSLIFFNRDWEQIGNKNEMAADIKDATGIPKKLLQYRANANDFSVAQKMSWASSRSTSRIEDMAYCLLGLFRVQMPLLYGEGHHAFRRLQEEIMKTSSDETLFAWSPPTSAPPHHLLAPTTAHFSGCGQVEEVQSFWRKPYSMTNKGLKLSTALYRNPRILRIPENPERADLLIPLNCSRQSNQRRLAMIANHPVISLIALPHFSDRDGA
jgi:hypothetical protein